VTLLFAIWEAKDASPATGSDCHRVMWLNKDSGEDSRGEKK